MTEENEDPNAPDINIIRQIEMTFEKYFGDEIVVGGRYSCENNFGNLEETNQFILNEKKNTPNYFNEIDDSFSFWILDNSKNNNIFNPSNFILFDELNIDITSKTSIYSEKKQIFMNIGANIGKKRKFMKDMIRKRIKSDFYRVIRKNLNSKINSKFINLKKSFDFPQTMITNVSKNHCKKNLNMTLKEILKFYYKTDNQEINSINLMISENNKSIILLLENKKIDELEYIFSKKIVDLYNEYTKSNQFHESILELKKEGNYFDYIKKYIEVAEKLVNYYYQKSSCEEEY